MGVNALGRTVLGRGYRIHSVCCSENFIVALLRCIGLLYIFLLYREAVELPTMCMRHATRTIARRSHTGYSGCASNARATSSRCHWSFHSAVAQQCATRVRKQCAAVALKIARSDDIDHRASLRASRGRATRTPLSLHARLCPQHLPPHRCSSCMSAPAMHDISHAPGAAYASMSVGVAAIGTSSAIVPELSASSAATV